jgi:hypothetical protein
MGVQSYLELYTTLFGWHMYGVFWGLLSKTGLVYVPFVFLIAENFGESYRLPFSGLGALSALSNMEIDIAIMLTVVVLAGQPTMRLEASVLDLAVPCEGNVVSQDSDGSTFKDAFDASVSSAEYVPVLWRAVLSIGAGFARASINQIPCAGDIRAVRAMVSEERIADPALQDEIRSFVQSCYIPAVARFNDENPEGVESEDVSWIGSPYFLGDASDPGNSAFYATFRARKPVPGWPFDPAIDVEYPSGYEPDFGRPRCDQWWADESAGIRTKLTTSLNPTLMEKFGAIFGDGDDAMDALLRKVVTLDTALSAPDGSPTVGGYGDSGITGAFQHAAGSVGLLLEQFSLFPKVYLVRQLVPIAQAIILMCLYMLLPFALVFGRYSAQVTILMSVVIFSVQFWSVLFALASALDNQLLAALMPSRWAITADNSVTDDLINICVMMLFTALPLLWTALLGWAGYSVGNALAASIETMRAPAESAGERGGQAIRVATSKVAATAIKKSA